MHSIFSPSKICFFSETWRLHFFDWEKYHVINERHLVGHGFHSQLGIDEFFFFFWRRWPAFAENQPVDSGPRCPFRCGLQCSRSKRKTLRWHHIEMVGAGSARGVNAPKTGIPYTSHLGETNRLSHAKSATSHEQHVSYHETFVKLFWKLPRATKIFNQMNQLECYFGYWGIDFDLCLSPKHSSNMFRFLSSKRGDSNRWKNKCFQHR